MDIVEEDRPQKFKSLSSKFSLFMGVLVLWVVATILLWDIRQHTFDWTKGVVLCSIVLLVAAFISRFTIGLLARPLALLQAGITSVREGKLQTIQVSRTGDEIEYLGESFNRMIQALVASQEEIHQHRELLEDRIRQRTEDLEIAMHSALAASQAKSEFLANMSHELRTPMNGLLGMLDLVLDGQLGAEQKDQLETAQRCAYALLALLNDILDLSKIEAGKMILEKIPFNVGTVVEDCVKGHTAKAAQKGVDLTFEIDPLTPTAVLGDPLRLRQIVANLVSNAVKFTDRGWVKVKVSSAPIAASESLAGESQGQDSHGQDSHGQDAHGKSRFELSIEVSDTGTGIPPDKLPAIFDKFTQVDGSISRKYGGTGLGLAITRRLAEMHGGSVQVASRWGQGSTFTVKLPCEPSVVAVVESKPNQNGAQAQPAPRSGSRLLLVEDNLVNQKVVLAILRKKGYHIDVANDGREALDRLEAPGAAYDLVLMDVQMPVLDGLEATRAIRRNARWDRLPILAMTAHAMNGDKERCLQAGMTGYISKPVQPAHLIATVERFLDVAVEGTPVYSGTQIERVLADRLMAEDSGLVNDLLQLFLQLAPERLDRLETAALQCDSVALLREARKIRLAAEQLASPGVATCAQRIEEAAAAGDFALAKQNVGTLRQEIQSLEALTT